jgi:hypothetical protein
MNESCIDDFEAEARWTLRDCIAYPYDSDLKHHLAQIAVQNFDSLRDYGYSLPRALRQVGQAYSIDPEKRREFHIVLTDARDMAA